MSARRWEAEIRDYASKNYASHIDHSSGIGPTPGGVHPGSNATVKDSMLLHNELVDAFRAINPKIASDIQSLGMANPRGKRGWPGYKDHRSICDAGVLPKDVGIAQTTRARSRAYDEGVTATFSPPGTRRRSGAGVALILKCACATRGCAFAFTASWATTFTTCRTLPPTAMAQH
jgi:hypothetical protein